MSEIAILRGKLRERILQAKEIELRMQTCLENIRAALPSHTPMMGLAAKAAAEEATILAALQTSLRDLNDDIKAIRKDLDED